MTDKEIIEIMSNQPVQFFKEESSLDKLKNRWVGLIRHNGSALVKLRSASGIETVSPDLFDIANEIEAFFVGLSLK